MKLLKNIKRKLAIRFQYLIRKRKQKIQVKKVIEKYNLNNKEEQQKLIDQFILIQKNKGGFGRKTKLHIKEKIYFMIYHKLIEIK